MEIKGVPEIIWPGAARLTMECDTPYWMVYSQDEDGICIEFIFIFGEYIFFVLLIFFC